MVHFYMVSKACLFSVQQNQRKNKGFVKILILHSILMILFETGFMQSYQSWNSVCDQSSLIDILPTFKMNNTFNWGGSLTVQMFSQLSSWWKQGSIQEDNVLEVKSLYILILFLCQKPGANAKTLQSKNLLMAGSYFQSPIVG